MPGPDWYRGIMALYANLAGAKEKKKAGEQEAEDRAWQELLRPMEQRKIEADIAQSEAGTMASRATTKRAEETPIAKLYSAPRGALITAAKAQGYDISDVDSWSPDFQKQVIEGHQDILLRQTETAAQAKKEEELEYKERKRQIDQNRKDRVAKRKEFNQTVMKIGVNERRIAELKSKASQAATRGDTISVSTWAQEKERLATENAVLEAYRDSMYKDVLPESTGATTKYKAGDTKVVGGITYYYWSDGGWHNNPESSPQKR